MRRYEGMFLFDNSVARDWSAVEKEVHRLCDRIGAELLVCVKFDERKLAYEIKRRKRGTYVLTYFEAPPERIGDLERDARLSESILRLLVLRADHVPEARIQELKLWPAETSLQPAGDGRRHDDHRKSAAKEKAATEAEKTPAASETAAPEAPKPEPAAATEETQAPGTEAPPPAGEPQPG